MDVNVTTTELVWEETTSVTSPTSHTDPPVSSNDRSLLYILLPIFAVVLVATFSVAVSVLVRRKRRLDVLRHQLVPFYNFAPGEEEDWETELDTTVRRDYNTMSAA